MELSLLFSMLIQVIQNKIPFIEIPALPHMKEQNPRLPTPAGCCAHPQGLPPVPSPGRPPALRAHLSWPCGGARGTSVAGDGVRERKPLVSHNWDSAFEI